MLTPDEKRHLCKFFEIFRERERLRGQIEHLQREFSATDKAFSEAHTAVGVCVPDGEGRVFQFDETYYRLRRINGVVIPSEIEPERVDS